MAPSREKQSEHTEQDAYNLLLNSTSGTQKSYPSPRAPEEPSRVSGEQVMADPTIQNQEVVPELSAASAPRPPESDAPSSECGVSEREPTDLFDLAWATFERDKPELLKTHYGQWVLYHGDQRYGPFKDAERLRKLAVDDRVLRRIDNYDPYDVTIAF